MQSSSRLQSELGVGLKDLLHLAILLLIVATHCIIYEALDVRGMRI